MNSEVNYGIERCNHKKYKFSYSVYKITTNDVEPCLFNRATYMTSINNLNSISDDNKINTFFLKTFSCYSTSQIQICLRRYM